MISIAAAADGLDNTGGQRQQSTGEQNKYSEFHGCLHKRLPRLFREIAMVPVIVG
jgi:hypothetical protein